MLSREKAGLLMAWLARGKTVIVFFAISMLLCFVDQSFAAPNILTYQGRILKSDGTPLAYNNVSFIFQITNPSGSCVIYQEQVTGIDFTNAGGIFDLPIGAGTISFPLTVGVSVVDTFNNIPVAPFTCGSCSGYTCTNGANTYSPAASDGRLLKVKFFDGSSWETITPDSAIRAVPYAGVASSAEKLGNNVASDFLLKAGLPTCNPGTFLTWNGTGFTCAAVSGITGGTVTNVAGTAPISVATGSSTPVISFSNGTAAGQVHRWDGTSSWVATNLRYTDLVNSTSGSPWPSVSCTTGEAVVWNSASDAFSCSTLSIATSQLTGILAAAQLPAFIGDVTSSAGSNALTLANSGATAGTYSKVTVDAKGRVTAGANIGSSDVTTALGYTPVNKAGDTMTGTLGLAQLASDPNTTGWTSTQKGYTWFDTTTNQVKYWDGSAIQSLGVSGAGLTNLNGQSGATQTFATSTTGTDFSISSATNTHTFNLPSASGTARGLLTSADWTTFNSKLGSSLTSAQIFVGNGSNVAIGVAMSGDATIANTGALTIANNAITSAKINALAVTDAKINDVGVDKITSGATKYFTYKPNNTACTNGQILSWDNTNSRWVCANDANSGGTVTSITAGTGLTGGAITGSGTIGLGTELTGVNGLSTTGYVQRTGAGAYSTTSASTTASNNTLVQRDGSGVSNFYGVGVTGATSGTVTQRAPATVTSYSVTWPSAAAGAANSVLASDTSGNLSWINLGSVAGTINLTSQVTGVLPIANGGTNSSTALTNNQLMFSNAGAIKELGAMTDGQIVVGKSAASPQIVSMSGDVTILNTGATTVGKINGTTVTGVGLANNNLLQNTSGGAIAGNSVLVSNGTATGVTSLSTPGSSVLTSTGGSVPTWSSISADTFTQYALLAGRSGGQTIYGGTAASNNLTLDSTSHATKGYTLINPSGGNVGIGTTSPGNILTINKNTTTIPTSPANSDVYLVGADATGTGFAVDSFGAGASLTFRQANGTNASKSAILSGGGIGTINFMGYGTTAYTGSKARIGALATENWTDTANGTAIRFFTTANTTTTMNEAMRIDNTGNVGIGTTTPGTKLEVTGSVRVGNGGETCGASYTGAIRYNSPNIEFCNGTAWTILTSGAGSSYLASSGGSLSGGLTISTGGETITAGGLTVSAGGINANSTGITNAGSITGVGSNITGSSAVTIASGGTAQNLTLNSSTTGSVNVGSGNGTQLSVLDGGASTVNYVTVKGAAASGSPVIGTAGSDANINLTLTPKGTGNTIISSGNVGIGTTSPVATLSINGSLATKLNVQTTNYSLTSSDHVVTTGGTALTGAITFTLPSAIGIGGRQYVIKKTDPSSYAVTINTTSSQTVDGAASYVLSSQYNYVTLVSDGSNWVVVGNLGQNGVLVSGTITVTGTLSKTTVNTCTVSYSLVGGGGGGGSAGPGGAGGGGGSTALLVDGAVVASASGGAGGSGAGGVNGSNGSVTSGTLNITAGHLITVYVGGGGGGGGYHVGAGGGGGSGYYGGGGGGGATYNVSGGTTATGGGGGTGSAGGAGGTNGAGGTYNGSAGNAWTGGSGGNSNWVSPCSTSAGGGGGSGNTSGTGSGGGGSIAASGTNTAGGTGGGNATYSCGGGGGGGGYGDSTGGAAAGNGGVGSNTVGGSGGNAGAVTFTYTNCVGTPWL